MPQRLHITEQSGFQKPNFYKHPVYVTATVLSTETTVRVFIDWLVAW